MADTKGSDLTELTTLAATDLLYAIDDPAGTPASRKITMLNAVRAALGLTSSDSFEARTVLHEETLASAGSFDVSSISQGYDHLELRLLLRSNASVTADGVIVALNNDTTAANYRRQRILAQNTTLSALGSDDNVFGFATGASSTSGDFSSITATILNYAGGQGKMIQATISGRLDATNSRVDINTINWESTSAINRITIKTDNDPTDQFIAGSYLQIIGVKTVG